MKFDIQFTKYGVKIKKNIFEVQWEVIPVTKYNKKVLWINSTTASMQHHKVFYSNQVRIRPISCRIFLAWPSLVPTDK